MKYLITLFLFANYATAAMNKNLPEKLFIESDQYKLCKQHAIKYAYIVKIAYVGLYLKDCKSDQDLLNISDKLIRFNYQVNVKAHIFSDAAKKYFMKNVLNAVSQHELIELNRFNEFYENVKATEYYDLYHQQGKRLKLFKNEKLLGISENKSFSYNYFNIWFGNNPAVKPLKRSFIN
jgi:hypothetical protein